MEDHKSANIGFVGLGAMGFGMATHLVKQGYNVKGFDVFPKSIERFKEAGGVPAQSLEDSASNAEFYIVMVATAVQAQDALFDNKQAIVPALPKNSTLLLASTVPSSYAQSVASQLENLGRTDISFIDCPVSGGAARAAAGTLSLMVGASDSAIQKGRWLLQELSDTNKLFIVPGGIGQGSNLKMLHQVLAGIQILASSEAMGFAARLGLDAKEVRERVVGSDSWSWMFENRSTRILGEDYFPGVSALTIILKDVGIITSQSRLHAFPTPLISASEQAYLGGLSLGYGPHDDAGMVRLYFSERVSSVVANYTSTSSTAPANSTEAKTAETNVEGDKEAKLQLVLNLLRYIHIAAAAEAIAYAHFLQIDLAQFYELCNDAAGGSRMFRIKGEKMIQSLQSATTLSVQGLVSSIASTVGAVQLTQTSTAGDTVDDAVKALSEVCQTARDKNCPLYVGSATLNVFLMAKRRAAATSPDYTVINNWNV